MINTQRVLRCDHVFACERGLVNGSATFRSICILQISMSTMLCMKLLQLAHFQYVSKLRLRFIQIGVIACIDVTLYIELFVTSITEKHFLSPL